MKTAISRYALMMVLAICIFSTNIAFADTEVKESAANNGGLPTHFWTDLVAAFAFGLVVILLVIIGYKTIDWALRGIHFDTELAKGNISVGIVVAAIIIGISHAVSSVVVAILH